MDADTRRWLEKLERKQDAVAEDVARIRGILENGIVRSAECTVRMGGNAESVRNLRSRVNWLYGLLGSLFLACVAAVIAMLRE